MDTWLLSAGWTAHAHSCMHAPLMPACLHACRYFRASGMRQRSLLFRLNTLALAAAFLATHLGVPLWVLRGELLRCRASCAAPC